MEKVYVGLDMGSSSFQQAALNQEGAVATLQLETQTLEVLSLERQPSQ